MHQLSSVGGSGFGVYVSVVNAVAELCDIDNITSQTVIDDPVRLVWENIGVVIRIILRVRQRDDSEIWISVGGFDLTIKYNC